MGKRKNLEVVALLIFPSFFLDEVFFELLFLAQQAYGRRFRKAAKG